MKLSDVMGQGVTRRGVAFSYLLPVKNKVMPLVEPLRSARRIPASLNNISGGYRRGLK